MLRKGPWSSRLKESIPLRYQDRTKPIISFKRLHPNAKIPTYETDGSSGADVYAVEGMFIAPGERVLIPLGFSVAIPHWYEIQVRPRSGLAYKKGITVLNTPGTIDSDYRGEIKVILINQGHYAFEVKPGDRIAQLVLAPVRQAKYLEVEVLDGTVRGEGGIGSTGTN